MRLIDADELKDTVIKLRDLAIKREEDTPVNSPFFRTYSAQAIERKGFIKLIDEAQTIEFPTVINMKPLTAEEKQGLIDAFKKSGLKAVKLDDERPQDRWIPVSERTPDDLEPVNITWINHEPEPYYKEIKGKPFTATGVYFNGQWYWWSTLCTDTLAEYSNNFDDVIDTAIEVIAWRPLPEPYKKEGE